MFQIQISQSIHLTIFITVLLIAVSIQECCAGSLVTTPPAIGGVLTSCGETQLTCSHDNFKIESTRWAITSMDSSSVCLVIIDHNIPTPEAPYSCDDFMFENITGLRENVSDLNSTAMVNPLPLDLSGSRMECSEGPVSTSPLIGTVTLCVIDQLSRPVNVRSLLLPNNLSSVVLEWDTLTTCSRDTVFYTIAIDGADVLPDNITVLSSTRYIVSGLEANRIYTASVRTVVSNCMSDKTNITFKIMAQTPTPVVDTRFFCANSSDLITSALSWRFPSSAPSGVVYPPISELSVTVSVSDSSGLISNPTFSGSRSNGFFNSGNNGSYTISVEASHDTTGSSTPKIFLLTTFIFNMDTSTTLEDDHVTVRLNDSCVEDPTTFKSTLSYGSCPDYVTFQESQAFSSSGTAVFVLDLNSVTGELCIQVVVAHQSQPNHPLNTLERQLTFRSCAVAPINSVASCSVSVEFSLSESLGQVPHGTIATFKPLSECTDLLVGAEHSTCFNGDWSDLSQRTSSSPGLSVSEAVAITFVLTMISTLIVGVISSSLVTYCIMKRRASEDLAAPNQPKGPLYEEVSQPKTSEQVFEMGDNIAYGPVRH